MKKKKIDLVLNKEVINQLDKSQAKDIKGGEAILSLFGSNCYNTNPLQHACCAGTPTVSGACVSVNTITDTTAGVCSGCSGSN